jgi:hypothetical protein
MTWCYAEDCRTLISRTIIGDGWGGGSRLPVSLCQRADSAEP